jgi:hypothetical protein
MNARQAPSPNIFGSHTTIVQNLLSFSIFNDNIHQKEIHESIVNLLSCLKNSDMLLELEKAITSRIFNTNCVIVPR